MNTHTKFSMVAKLNDHLYVYAYMYMSSMLALRIHGRSNNIAHCESIFQNLEY